MVLAAGFGTRLRASLEASEEHRHLLEVPKPLLPLAGTTIAESWAAEMGQQGKVVLVSNARDAPRYAALFGVIFFFPFFFFLSSCCSCHVRIKSMGVVKSRWLTTGPCRTRRVWEQLEIWLLLLRDWAMLR